MRRRLLGLVLALAACSASAKAPATTGPAAPVAPPPQPLAPLVIPTATGAGKVLTHHFHSDALGVDKDYVVYLPGGYGADPHARWPVLYYLNGLGGDERNWIDGGDLAGAADKLHLAAIVVMPDGDDGFYANSVTPRDYDACIKDGTGLFDPSEDRAKSCVRTANYEDYIVRDLIGHVDATYATIADRRARGIAGDSMGGFGAFALAMRHTDLFSAAASHSGVVALLYMGPHPYTPGAAPQLVEDVATWGRIVEPIGGWVRAIFGPDRANWLAHDPAALAQQLVPGALALYLDCGTEDIFALNDSAAYLHDLLTARGIAHSYYVGPGRHDFDFFRARVSHSLAFFAAHFAGQPEPVEEPAAAPAEATPAPEIKLVRTVASEGVPDDLVEHLGEGVVQGARVCAAKTHPADGIRELAIGVTDQAELADIRWFGGGKPDDFDDCMMPPPPASMDEVRYIYLALSIGSGGPTPAAPTIAADLADVCKRSTEHVRHPDVLAMLHEMAVSEPAQKVALLKAALAKAKIAVKKCPLLAK